MNDSRCTAHQQEMELHFVRTAAGDKLHVSFANTTQVVANSDLQPRHTPGPTGQAHASLEHIVQRLRLLERLDQLEEECLHAGRRHNAVVPVPASQGGLQATLCRAGVSQTQIRDRGDAANPRALLDKTMSRSAGTLLWEMVVDAGVPILGWSPSRMPPQQVQVEQVDEDSFAEDFGLRAGDELLAVDGESVSAIAPVAFAQRMAARPLMLLFKTETMQDIDCEAAMDGDGLPHPSKRIMRQSRFVALTVEEDIELLGFSPALPPNPVVIEVVYNGSWAQDQLLLPGDELLSIDGSSAKDLDPEQFQEILSMRPLRLCFLVHGLSIKLHAVSSVARLGWGSRILSSGRILVHEVHANSWAALHGIRAFDELVSVNGKSTTTLQQAELKELMRIRPLNMEFFRSSLIGSSSVLGSAEPHPDFQIGSGDKEFVAGEDVSALGLATEDDLQGRVLVSEVIPGSWAAHSGIQVGWQLLFINGFPVSTLAPEVVAHLVKARPLRLSFLEEPS